MTHSNYLMVLNEDLGRHLRYKNWRDLTIGFFDLETTDKDPFDSSTTRACQFCCMLYRRGEEVDTKTVFINPEIPINPEASEFHKIYDEHVEDKPTMKDIGEELYDFMDQADILVAYNGLAFDYPLIQREFSDAGLGLFCKPMIDPLVFYRKRQQKFSKTKLIDAAIFYSVQGLAGVAHGVDLLHDAEVDVKMMKEVLLAMGVSDVPWSLDETLEKQLNLWMKQEKYLSEKYDDREYIPYRYFPRSDDEE